MQINTMSYHFKDVRMPVIKKTRENKYCLECGEYRMQRKLLLGMQIVSVTMDANINFPQIKLELPCDPAIPLLCIY